MKFAILADIHANLEALQAVLQDSKTQSCNQYVFLGDFVGYCADPKACLDIVRDLNAPCVKGNHDAYCSTDQPMDGFNPLAARAVQWTRNQLSSNDRLWLQNLPYVSAVSDFTIVHATLDHPEKWGYVFDKIAAAASLKIQKTQLCFFGHTHVPVAFILDDAVRGGTYSKFLAQPGKRYFVNAGSVGQPRDHNPKAGYVIYDSLDAIIELRRLDYDITTTQKKIRDAGLR